MAEVVGKIDIDSLAGFIKSACADKKVAAEVHELKLSPLPQGARRTDVLGDNGMPYRVQRSVRERKC